MFSQDCNRRNFQCFVCCPVNYDAINLKYILNGRNLMTSFWDEFIFKNSIIFRFTHFFRYRSFFSQGEKVAENLMLIAHCHLEPRLRMSGGVPLFLLYAFMVWIGSILTLPYLILFYFFNCVPNCVGIEVRSKQTDHKTQLDKIILLSATCFDPTESSSGSYLKHK